MQTVQLVDVTIKAPKELNDVRVALVNTLTKIRAKKPLAQVAVEELAELAAAVDGMDKIPEEFRVELAKSSALTGLMGGEVAGVLLQPAPTA